MRTLLAESTFSCIGRGTKDALTKRKSEIPSQMELVSAGVEKVTASQVRNGGPGHTKPTYAIILRLVLRFCKTSYVCYLYVILGRQKQAQAQAQAQGCFDYDRVPGWPLLASNSAQWFQDLQAIMHGSHSVSSAKASSTSVRIYRCSISMYRAVA